MTRPEEDELDEAEGTDEYSEESLDVDPVDLDLDLEEDDDDGEADDDADSEELGAEAGGDEGEGGEAKPKARKSKVRGNKEEEPEPGDPETPVPSKKKMISALEWAFEGEEEVGPELLERFAQHALMVLDTNRVMNLTAIQDPREVAAKHYLDSWRLTRLLPLIAKKVLDLGCGAGFPGVPLALAEPNLSMTLVDSTRKKAEFVQSCLDELGVRNARALWDRAEDHLTSERVDIVVVRAVSSVRENIRTVRKVRHALKDMVMLKGNSWSREVRAAEREAERLGFKLDTVWEHELPGEMGQRAVLVYRAPGGHGL